MHGNLRSISYHKRTVQTDIFDKPWDGDKRDVWESCRVVKNNKKGIGRWIYQK